MDEHATNELLTRLRANAARAGIRLTDEDIARIGAGAYFHNVAALDRLVNRVPAETLPDFLKDWRPDATNEAREGR